ncbi:unnamed protein product [Leuciscus chuanchicus]
MSLACTGVDEPDNHPPADLGPPESSNAPPNSSTGGSLLPLTTAHRQINNDDIISKSLQADSFPPIDRAAQRCLPNRLGKLCCHSNGSNRMHDSQKTIRRPHRIP